MLRSEKIVTEEGGELCTTLTWLDLHKLIGRQSRKCSIELCVIAFIVEKIMFTIKNILVILVFMQTY